MRSSHTSDEQKANFLIGHLDGVALEKVEEITDESHKSYSAIVSHLRSCFESPQQRYVAHQKLSSFKLEPT